MSGRTVRGKDPAKFTQVDENIILCKISGYQFSIEELSVIEILPIQVQISSVPGSPKWVKGVFDFHGDSIPIISLASWLELSENDNNANICIVLKSQNKTFAILSETVTTITKPDKSYFKHPGDKVLKNLLYKNIFNYADEKTFVLNVDVIAENFAQDTLSANWKLWMEFVHTQKESIKLKEGPRKKSVTQNLAKLEYRGLKILLTVDDSFNIYPDTNVFHELQNFPNYYIGTVDLDNRVSVAIDFSKFLKLPFVEVEGKHVYLKLGDFMGDIAMKVPVPNIIHVDIEKSRTLTKKTSKLNVPSAKYILLENEIYLYMDSSQLLKFFQNEFINMLKEEWQKNIPKWDIKPEEIAMPEHHIIKSTRVATETSAPTSVVVDEYVVCDLGQIKIAFEQKYLYQLISNDVVISSIPDAPEWVFGVMDHESEDVVVIDMAKWLDIKVNQNNPRMVVLEIYNRKISFPCLNTELVEKSIADQSYFRETLIKKKGIPFGNIFRDVKHGYVFLLNEEQLLSAAYQTYFQDIWKENWNEFLHIGKVNIKTTISMEFQRLSELDSVITNIEGHSFVLPVEYIETIRETNKQELLYQGIPIIAYDGKWIPTINLNNLISDTPSEFSQYALVINDGSVRYNINTNDVRLTTKERNLVNDKSWNHILKENGSIGLTSLIQTRDGNAYEFNPAKVKVRLSEKNNPATLQNIATTISKANIEPPELDEDIELKSDSYMQIWEKDTKLFLSIQDTELTDFENIAFSVDEISMIYYEPQPDMTIEKWLNTNLTGKYIHIYIETMKTGNKKLFEIPASSKLLAVHNDKITTEGKNTILSLTDKQYKIISPEILFKS